MIISLRIRGDYTNQYTSFYFKLLFAQNIYQRHKFMYFKPVLAVTAAINKNNIVIKNHKKLSKSLEDKSLGALYKKPGNFPNSEKDKYSKGKKLIKIIFLKELHFYIRKQLKSHPRGLYFPIVSTTPTSSPICEPCHKRSFNQCFHSCTDYSGVFIFRSFY